MGEPPPELISFCREEWPRLVGALRLMTGDVELAKELAQETVARVCRDWRKVARMDAQGAWAHRVAMNLARSHFRRRAIERRSLAKRAAIERNTDTLDIAGAVTVRAAVLALPRRQRMVIVLRYFVDLPVREVAVVMRCPEGTVKTLTRQAILALRTAGQLVDDDENIEERWSDVT